MRSVAINGVGSFLLFRLATPHYPTGSAYPLLWASVIPSFELVRGLVARRSVNFVAALVILDLASSLSVALFTNSLTAVFVARGLRHALVAVAFGISLLIDKPLVVPLGRQIIAGDDAERVRAFRERARQPKVHAAYRFATLVWTIALFAVAAVLVAVALAVHSPTVYVIDAVVSYGTYGLLGWWTTTFIRKSVIVEGAA